MDRDRIIDVADIMAMIDFGQVIFLSLFLSSFFPLKKKTACLAFFYRFTRSTEQSVRICPLPPRGKAARVCACDFLLSFSLLSNRKWRVETRQPAPNTSEKVWSSSLILTPAACFPTYLLKKTGIKGRDLFGFGASF